MSGAAGLLSRFYPALALGLFFVLPLLLLAFMSFLEPSGRVRFLFEGTWQNYAGFFADGWRENIYLTITWRSIWMTGLAAGLVVSVIFPALLIITNMARRWQLFWIMVLLSLLCLSEVVIGYTWVLFLLKSTGLPGWLEAAGIWPEAESLTQTLGAVLLGLFTLGISIAGLLMYPQLAGRDRSLEEAARTLGTPPRQIFFRLLIPVHVPVILSTFIALYVYLLGAYSVLKLLGRKQEHQTLVWRIFERAGAWDGLPEAAALSILLLLLTSLMLLVPFALRRRGGGAS